jgi:hypothetical protein
VLVAYADHTSKTNDDVIVRRSLDGGLTWPDVNNANERTVNGPNDGRRFLPWICVTNGTAHVSWYDRRTSTDDNNSLTTYYWSAGFPRLLGEGQVGQFSGAEANVSGVADPQCASPFGFGLASVTDAEDATKCLPEPPFVPGTCQNGSGGGSNGTCNLRDPQPTCPDGESCKTGAGLPKYGDYNGNACANGNVYLAWASATPPPFVTSPPPGINVYMAVRSPPPPCVPTQRACDPRAQCGTQDDGCGVLLNCGTCSSDSFCLENSCLAIATHCVQYCRYEYSLCMNCDRSRPGCPLPSQCATGQQSCLAGCNCKPKTCADLGVQCGSPDDTCGHPLDCGRCPSGSTCSGGRCTRESACLQSCDQQYLDCMNCDRSMPGCPTPSACASTRNACRAACR